MSNKRFMVRTVQETEVEILNFGGESAKAIRSFTVKKSNDEFVLCVVVEDEVNTWEFVSIVPSYQQKYTLVLPEGDEGYVELDEKTIDELRTEKHREARNLLINEA